MKKQSFAVGDRVGANVHVAGANEWDDGELKTGLRWEEYVEPAFGKVIGILPDGKVQVEWDEDAEGIIVDYLDGDMLTAKQLLPEADVKSELSRLEKEFNEVQKQVNAKCNEASKLLKEANKLAQKTGRSLNDMDHGNLYSTMDACGWRTSSFGC